MITYSGDTTTDTVAAGGAYGPSTNIHTRTMHLAGSYQPRNYTYQYANYNNHIVPKTRTASTALLPWSSRTQETYTVIQPTGVFNTLIDNTRLSSAPTESTGWWTGGVLERYVLKGEGVTRVYDEHHAMIAIDTGALSIPSWVSSKDARYWAPGYNSLVASDTPTDSRATAFHYRFPYSDELGCFGGYTRRMQPAHGIYQYVIDLSDGAVYAPFLNTGVTDGTAGPMWWGVPNVTLVVYGVTYGNSGGVGIPGSYTVTLRGEDRKGNLTVIQSWSGAIPVINYDSTNDRSAVSLSQPFSGTASSGEFVVYKWSTSVSGLDFIHTNILEAPFTPACHPGITNDHVTGSRIPMGWLMKVKDAI